MYYIFLTVFFVAFHAFGSSGKTVVELSIILLMIGTCIAFFVVMGDLGPAIIGSLLNIDYSAAFRPAVLIGINFRFEFRGDMLNRQNVLKVLIYVIQGWHCLLYYHWEC